MPVSQLGIWTSGLVVGSDAVDAYETSATTVYGDLATVGPSVTINTGTAALVILNAKVRAQNYGTLAYMSVEVSGASAIAADDAHSLMVNKQGTGGYYQNLIASAMYRIAGLTPGVNTFTAKYRQDTTTGGGYLNRTLLVIPL